MCSPPCPTTFSFPCACITFERVDQIQSHKIRTKSSRFFLRLEEEPDTVQTLLVALLTGSSFGQQEPSREKSRTRWPAQLGRRYLPSSKPWLGVEAGLTDKTTWAAPSTIYIMVNHGSFLGIWFSLIYLQGSLPATYHRLGMQLFLITLAFFLKPGLTTGESEGEIKEEVHLELERSADP